MIEIDQGGGKWRGLGCAGGQGAWKLQVAVPNHALVFVNSCKVIASMDVYY